MFDLNNKHNTRTNKLVPSAETVVSLPVLLSFGCVVLSIFAQCRIFIEFFKCLELRPYNMIAGYYGINKL